MSLLLCVCISAFLVLFALNNDADAILSSPIALGIVGLMMIADLYLLRSLLRDWRRRRG